MLCVFLLCFFGLPMSSYGAADFETKSFDVTINVKDDNSAYITENVKIDARNPIHGIYRYIPLSNTVRFYDKDGKEINKARKNMRVEDITVEKDPFEADKQNGNMFLKIGDPDKTFTGKHDYSYSYRARLYDDGIKDYDIFYYNVLPSDWETDIPKSTITLNMPAEFKKKDVHVMAGRKGKEYGDDYVDWTVEGNTITIELAKLLPAGSYLTVGIMLPEGYFKNELSDRKTYLFLYGMGLLAAAFMIWQWWRKGRDPKAVKTVEFYPPEDMSPAEVGYVIDGSVERGDVTSLIIYFANKGYLAIEERYKGEYYLHKLRDLPSGAKTYESILFNGLFALEDEVALDALPSNIYEAFQGAKEAVRMEFRTKDKRIFSKQASRERVICFALTIVVLLTAGFLLSRLFGSYLLMLPGIAVLGLTIASYILAIRGENRRHAIPPPRRVGTSLISLLLLAGAMLGVFFYMNLTVGSKKGAVIYILLLACGYFAVRYMRARTAYGTELLGKLLGFKEFIAVSELDKLEMLAEEDPQYFYNVLPYAHVMGLSKTWAKKFEGIAQESPDWYSSDYGGSMGFNSWIFYRSFSGCMKSMDSSIGVSPDGGSGFTGSAGGGGFSGGGGFGGGGGGSW